MRPGPLGSLLALVVATAAPAQTIRGVVTTGDSTAVGGAVLTLLDPSGAAVATALSDEFGVFEVRAPRAGTWRLRTERTGLATVLSLPTALAAGQTVVRRVQLRESTARLSALRVTDRARCDARPAEGTQVATLWEEARKSLAAAAAATAASPLFALDRDEIEYDSTFTRAYAAVRSTTTGRIPQVFRSAPPASLRALGYVRVIDSATVYFGPDARVLLSPDFAATHCFTFAGDDPGSIRRVGLGFTPVGRPRGVVDVAGTLWLDRESYELDRVEFRFAPSLSEDHPDSTFGGVVRFARLPGGQVIVREWVLRMPIVAAAAERRTATEGATSRMLVRAEAREVVTGLKVERGFTRLPEERPLPLPEVVPRRGRRTAPGCDADSLARAGEGWLAGTATDARGRSAANVTVRVAWHRAERTASRLLFREEWLETATDGEGRYALCGVPAGVALRLTAVQRDVPRLRDRLSVPAGEGTVRELRLAERALLLPPGTPGAARGRVTDAAGRPLAGAQLALFSPARRVTTDSLGRFEVDALAAGAQDLFVRRLGFAPALVSVVVSAGDTATLEVALEPAAQRLEAVTVEATVGTLNIRGFERRRDARLGGGIFLDQAYLEARQSSPLVNILRGAGRMTIQESQATGEVHAYGRGGSLTPAEGELPAGAMMSDTLPFNQRLLRGDVMLLERCPMILVVDGTVLVAGTPLNALPPTRDIAAIEVYTSSVTVPPQFAFANPKCGVIVVWTRDASAP